MAFTYSFPNAIELREIAQDLIPNLTRDRLAFQILPMETKDNEFDLAWEQMDNYYGLQHVRGLDGPPGRVQSVGGKRYLMEPGVYGDYMNLTESELTRPTRAWGSWDQRLDLSEIILRKQNLLIGREIDRQEWIIWTLLLTGQVFVAQESGGVLHADTYTLQTATASNWANPATGTPLADIRNAKLLARGHSVNFGASAKIYLNQSTANQLLANRNPADLGGQFSVTMNQVQPLIRNIETINQFFAGQDLPTFVVYDQGYLDADKQFQLYIPNGKTALVGQRPGGQAVGAYRLVRNANNPDMAAGSYSKVIDHGETRVPRTVEIHQGHSGGPVVWYGSAIATMNVGP